MGAPRNAFNAEYGTAQGRIAPSEAAPSGIYAFQLGIDRAGVTRVMSAGTHSIEQSFVVGSDFSYLRLVARIRPPTLPLPVGVSWQLRGIMAGVGGATLWTVDIAPGTRRRELHDLAIPMNAFRGSTMIVRLALALVGTIPDPIAIEIPGALVDGVVIDRIASGPLLISRLPEPDETGVDASEIIGLVVTNPAGSGGVGRVYPVTISIDGSPVLTANETTITFLDSGYTLVEAVMLDTYSVRYRIQRTAPFASLEVVHVGVAAHLDGNTSTTTSFAYDFTIADTTAPFVVEALAMTETTVRVTFDEPMLMGIRPNDIEDALHLDDYTISLVGGLPAVTPAVSKVEVDSDRSVILLLNTIQTPGAVYQVTVTGATDIAGNAVASPHNVATFTGYVWPALGKRPRLFDKLSEDIRRQDTSGEHERFLAVPQEIIDLYYGMADRALDIIDPDFAPEPWVGLMLSDFGNPFDFLDLTENEKRILAQTLIAIYRRKGTGPGIVSTMQFFVGIAVSIRVYAWAPYGIGEARIGETFVLGSSTQSDLYTFEVVTTDFLTADERKTLVAVVEYMKVAHEHWRLVEPTPPLSIDHWQLCFSRLSIETFLHPGPTAAQTLDLPTIATSSAAYSPRLLLTLSLPTIGSGATAYGPTLVGPHIWALLPDSIRAYDRITGTEVDSASFVPDNDPRVLVRVGTRLWTFSTNNPGTGNIYAIAVETSPSASLIIQGAGFPYLDFFSDFFDAVYETSGNTLLVGADAAGYLLVINQSTGNMLSFIDANDGSDEYYVVGLTVSGTTIYGVGHPLLSGDSVAFRVDVPGLLTDSYSTGDSFTGAVAIAADNSNTLWVVTSGGDLLSIPTSTMVAATVTVTGGTLGTPVWATWVAGYLWVTSGDGTLHKLSGGSIVDSYTTGSGTIGRLVYDGAHIWIAEPGGPTILKFDPADLTAPLMTITPSDAPYALAIVP